MTPEEIRAAGFEPHTEGDWPPDHVTETPLAYEVLRGNRSIDSADVVSASYWINGGKNYTRGVVGYRLACPHARRVIAAKDAEIARLATDRDTATREWVKRVEEIARLREGWWDLIDKLDGCKRFERGSGGMTIDAQIGRTVLIDVRATWVEEARALLTETQNV